MKLSAAQSQDPVAMMVREFRAGEKVVTQAMRGGARSLKSAWRDEIKFAGLGQRLANTVKSRAYPEGTDSMNAAAQVWTKAPAIIAAHDEGTLIQSKQGFWLAIPLPSAGRGRYDRRLSPAEYEQRTGRKLRFVARKGRAPLLVSDDARFSKTGRAVGKGGRRRKDGILTGAQTIPVFVLKKQVRLQKRTDLEGAAEQIVDAVAAQIAAGIGA